MKKLICLLLALALALAFAACQKKGSKTEETTADNYHPGEWITDASGVIQTTRVPVPVTGKDGKPVTTAIADKDGSTRYEAVTDYIDTIQTVPAREDDTLPTEPPMTNVPVGNTVPSQNKPWPTYAFMKALPKAADKVDFVTTSADSKGNSANIKINEYSYEQFLQYLKTLADAGFTKVAGNPDYPEKAKEGDAYYYNGASADGLHVMVSYYTDHMPQRNCDLSVTVTDYDVNGSN